MCKDVVVTAMKHLWRSEDSLQESDLFFTIWVTGTRLGSVPQAWCRAPLSDGPSSLPASCWFLAKVKIPSRDINRRPSFIFSNSFSF